MTLGEKRVRTEFNPARDTYIDQIKQEAAVLINTIDALANVHNESEPEFQEKQREWFRLKALALTAIEEGAMWAVKAATI